MIFGELDTRLSWVQRWVVVNTIKKQSVAEHCFNVERIARRIAVDWFQIYDKVQLDKISQIALHHDDEEAIIGDLPSPSKWVLGEKYLDEQRDVWYNAPCRELDIVKLADKMEAYQFLVMESMLGNTYVSGYIAEVFKKIIDSAKELGRQDHAYRWTGEISQMKGTTLGSAPRSTKQSVGGSEEP